MADLAAWLERIGLGEYAGAFAEAAIDLDVLPDLTEADLADLGVRLGDRKRLLKAIAARGDEAAHPHPLPAREVPAQAPPSPAAERRQLTVMFVDLVGSTALSGRLDPEDMSQVMRAYHGRTSEIIRRWGGHVAKYLGDGVLAYFGWPQAHEDDAERAVRAGLALTNAIAEIYDGAGNKLAVR
ncbi:MAG TPA: adenylate/guanylate cyclase domain-containing protein, partial [Geminicoccaceae bacterium]